MNLEMLRFTAIERGYMQASIRKQNYKSGKQGSDILHSTTDRRILKWVILMCARWRDLGDPDLIVQTTKVTSRCNESAGDNIKYIILFTSLIFYVVGLKFISMPQGLENTLCIS